MTARRSSGGRVRAPLTDLEHDVMRVVWTSGPCSVEAVHDVVARTRDVKETTVRTLLRRLEQKGYLGHAIEGRAYIYHAVEPSRSLAARAVRQSDRRRSHRSWGDPDRYRRPPSRRGQG